MTTVSQVLTGLVAALHVYFLVLEMFLWTTPTGQRVFGRTAEEQESSKVLAANQGLYNGFIAAGLAWSVFLGSDPISVFFLGCVIVAGVFGAITVSRKIFWVQGLPGLIALALVWFA